MVAMKIIATILVFLFAVLTRAEPVCVGGVCYPDEAAAMAAGVSFKTIQEAKKAHADPRPASDSDMSGATGSTRGPSAGTGDRRLKIGAMPKDEFLAFLRGTPASAPADDLESHSVIMVFLLVLLGGLAANLTPCVLPLVPVNLALVGKGAWRGAAYGLGITLAYGALGIAAAFGGMAFGAIQSNPWFNLFTATVFVVLGLAMSEVFFIDFAKYRRVTRTGGPFLLGVGAAVLAGACVEPILLATLVLTAKWFAAGKVWAVVLPFVLGAGMGLPWPFAAAGLSVLPKPGAWMRWVNRVFVLVLFGMAIWYGWLAWRGFSHVRAAENVAPPHDASERGAQSSRLLNRPILVVVGAPWCKNCTAMKRTVLREPDVVDEMTRFEVKYIEIDTPEDFKKYPELDGLDIPGVPAYVVIEPNKKETK